MSSTSGAPVEVIGVYGQEKGFVKFVHYLIFVVEVNLSSSDDLRMTIPSKRQRGTDLPQSCSFCQLNNILRPSSPTLLEHVQDERGKATCTPFKLEARIRAVALCDIRQALLRVHMPKKAPDYSSSFMPIVSIV